MTNHERIAANNVELTTCLTIAENLPESGGGGGAEMCALTITNSSNAPISISYHGSNGYEDFAESLGEGESTTIECVVNSLILFYVGFIPEILDDYGCICPNHLIGNGDENYYLIAVAMCGGEIQITEG